MSDLDPAAIRARAALATPGPWATGQPWATVSSGCDSIIHGYYEGWCDSCGDEITTSASVSVEGADAEHIAGMDPTTTLALLDRLEAAEAALERVRAIHRPVDHPEASVPVCADIGKPIWPCATIRALDEGGHR